MALLNPWIEQVSSHSDATTLLYSSLVPDERQAAGSSHFGFPVASEISLYRKTLPSTSDDGVQVNTDARAESAISRSETHFTFIGCLSAFYQHTSDVYRQVLQTGAAPKTQQYMFELVQMRPCVKTILSVSSQGDYPAAAGLADATRPTFKPGLKRTSQQQVRQGPIIQNEAFEPFLLQPPTQENDVHNLLSPSSSPFISTYSLKAESSRKRKRKRAKEPILKHQLLGTGLLDSLSCILRFHPFTNVDHGLVMPGFSSTQKETQTLACSEYAERKQVQFSQRTDQVKLHTVPPSAIVCASKCPFNARTCSRILTKDQLQGSQPFDWASIHLRTSLLDNMDIPQGFAPSRLSEFGLEEPHEQCKALVLNENEAYDDTESHSPGSSPSDNVPRSLRRQASKSHLKKERSKLASRISVKYPGRHKYLQAKLISAVQLSKIPGSFSQLSSRNATSSYPVEIDQKSRGSTERPNRKKLKIISDEDLESSVDPLSQAASTTSKPQQESELPFHSVEIKAEAALYSSDDG